MLLGTGVEAFEGDDRVERVRTADGRVIDCDFVVAGIGATPRTALAENTEIVVYDGLLTNKYLETEEKGIFAAGDVANARHPLFGGLRVDHWANALHQGPIAARNMLGAADSHDPVPDHPVAYDRIPYFYSDQHDVGMEDSGHATDWDEIVFRGDVVGREFIAFWLTDERIRLPRHQRSVAALGISRWRSGQPKPNSSVTDRAEHQRSGALPRGARSRREARPTRRLPRATPRGGRP